MVRFFYTLQTWFTKQNLFLKKITYRLLLVLIRLVVPLYYSLTPSSKSGVSGTKEHSPQVIVSLTSFPPRMPRLWMVLESLLRQTRKPDRLILWLASTQFPSLEAVDSKVRALQQRGLEIRFCDDLRSHKKYYYALQEFSHDLVITVDDDIFYSETLIADLLAKHQEYPDCVVCTRAHKMTFTDGVLNKYSDWGYGAPGMTGPAHTLLATNGSGVLYPPQSLSTEAFNRSALQELCPNADDIWLKCMGFMKGTKTVKVAALYSEIFTTLGSADSGLAQSNAVEGGNDQQLQKIIDRYALDFVPIQKV